MIKRYDSYKDSGVEWIGDIPSNWVSTKLNRYVFFQEGPGLRTFQFTDEGIKVICVTNITEKGIDFTYKKFISTEEYLEKYQHFTVEKGDLLLSSSGNSWGKVCEYKDDEKVMLNTSTIRLNTLDKNRFYKNLIKHILKSELVRKQLEILMTGSCQPNFGPSHLNQLIIPVPPLSEQQQIVSFLDTKTSLIDSLIEKTQRKIELLKEKRTSLINEVVTKGLNPNVEMKDSGVEWIGEIPSHWWVSKLGFLSKPIQGIQVDVENQLYNQHEGSERFIRISDYTMEEEPRYVDSYPESSIVNEEDLVMVRYGSKSGKVYSGIKGVICNNVFRIEHNEKLYTKFLSYFLNQESFYNQIEMSRDNNTLPQVSHGLYKEMKITIPVIQEQHQIVSYLDEQTKLIDNTISIEEKRMELLKEYRQSLISEVVTGKRKVVE